MSTTRWRPRQRRWRGRCVAAATSCQAQFNLSGIAAVVVPQEAEIAKMEVQLAAEHASLENERAASPLRSRVAATMKPLPEFIAPVPAPRCANAISAAANDGRSCGPPVSLTPVIIG